MLRLLSAYNFVLEGGKGGADEKCGQFIRANSSGFEDFVCNLLDEKFIYTWVHFVPQTYFIFNKNEELMIDKIVRLEDINNDFNSVKKALGIEGNLPLSNQGSEKTKIAITDIAKNKILRLYEKDYQLLGY
jgi:hypothetical protein